MTTISPDSEYNEDDILKIFTDMIYWRWIWLWYIEDIYGYVIKNKYYIHINIYGYDILKVDMDMVSWRWIWILKILS